MSAVGSLVDGVFGVNAPQANVPDYAASADPASSQANMQAEAAARRARRRNIDSYLIPTTGVPPAGSGLYIP